MHAIQKEPGASNELAPVSYDEDAVEKRLNPYGFWWVLHHNSAESSSYTAGTSSLDESWSQLIETYIFEVPGVRICKIIISLSPANFMISASSVHHIHGIWAKDSRCIWKDKPNLRALESRTRKIHQVFVLISGQVGSTFQCHMSLVFKSNSEKLVQFLVQFFGKMICSKK